MRTKLHIQISIIFGACCLWFLVMNDIFFACLKVIQYVTRYKMIRDAQLGYSHTTSLKRTLHLLSCSAIVIPLVKALVIIMLRFTLGSYMRTWLFMWKWIELPWSRMMSSTLWTWDQTPPQKLGCLFWIIPLLQLVILRCRRWILTRNKTELKYSVCCH